MLALLMCFGEDFEQFLSNRNRLALMTDHLPALYITTPSLASNSQVSEMTELTSGVPASIACSLNIFLTQNLIYLAYCAPKATDPVPKLSRLHSRILWINQDSPDVTGSFSMNQCLVLLLDGKIIDVARSMRSASSPHMKRKLPITHFCIN
jgi:hypothetical protein